MLIQEEFFYFLHIGGPFTTHEKQQDHFFSSFFSFVKRDLQYTHVPHRTTHRPPLSKLKIPTYTINLCCDFGTVFHSKKRKWYYICDNDKFLKNTLLFVRTPKSVKKYIA